MSNLNLIENGDCKRIPLLFVRGLLSRAGIETGFYFAAKLCKVECMREFLKLGADIEVADQHERTPLQVAIEEGNEDCVNFLLASGANIEAEDLWQHRPLHNAAMRGNENFVKLLLEAGADVEGGSTESGRTPLYFARSAKCVRLLLAAGADPNLRDKDGNTMLHAAVMNGCDSCVEPLLAAGIDINSQNSNGETPLHKAVNIESNGCLKCITTLLEAGADTNIRRHNTTSEWNSSWTPLEWAEIIGAPAEVFKAFADFAERQEAILRYQRMRAIPILRRAGVEALYKPGGPGALRAAEHYREIGASWFNPRHDTIV